MSNVIIDLLGVICGIIWALAVIIFPFWLIKIMIWSLFGL